MNSELRSFTEMAREAWAWSWLLAGIGFALGFLCGTAILLSFFLSGGL
jgi:hypothetical protein